MYTFVKRILDIFLSSLGLLFIFPISILIVIVLKLSGEGEVFYLQERMGYNNKPFYIYKFATMLKNSHNIGNKTVTVRNDPRITKFGRILRITKINELPQILNVLKGDMSLVGPRPLLISSFYKYTADVQEIIYRNKPGITGIGSLIFRDEELLVTTYKTLGKPPLDYYRLYIYPYKGSLEQWYYYNRCLSVDFKILFLTFWSLVNRNSQGIYKTLKNLPKKPDSLTLEGIHNL
jgi:lipopolysaccharide/colanic/teichoic acid biosynthesis glycosyltransferase|tara:strand:- start:225 stop:926 length:702 start_codon:yes stop_codon:yes gene_type:complete